MVIWTFRWVPPTWHIILYVLSNIMATLVGEYRGVSGRKVERCVRRGVHQASSAVSSWLRIYWPFHRCNNVLYIISTALRYFCLWLTRVYAQGSTSWIAVKTLMYLYCNKNIVENTWIPCVIRERHWGLSNLSYHACFHYILSSVI